MKKANPLVSFLRREPVFSIAFVCAVISAFLCKGLLYFFPCEVSVFATNSAITPVVY